MGRFQWRPGRTYRWRKITFYAMNGCICISDDRPDLPANEQFITVRRKEFLERAVAFSDQARALGRLAAEHPGRGYADERNETLTLVENMLECAREAKAQGDPNDPAVRAWFSRHSSRRKGRGSGKNFQTALPGPLPRGRDTGKQVTPDPFPVATKKLILPGA